MPIAEPETLDGSYELPQEFWPEIGKIVVRWAYLEHCLQRVVWGLLPVDPPAGRRAVNNPPNMGDWVSMIVDLAILRNVQLEKAMLDTLKKDAPEPARWRNLVAHGLWAQRPDGSWLVQNTKERHPEDVEGLTYQKRVLEPGGEPVDAAVLKWVVYKIEALIAIAEALRVDVLKQMKAKASPPAQPSTVTFSVPTSASSYMPPRR
jgi:hypothetical protein